MGQNFRFPPFCLDYYKFQVMGSCYEFCWYLIMNFLDAWFVCIIVCLGLNFWFAEVITEFSLWEFWVLEVRVVLCIEVERDFLCQVFWVLFIFLFVSHFCSSVEQCKSWSQFFLVLQMFWAFSYSKIAYSFGLILVFLKEAPGLSYFKCIHIKYFVW